jgi:hypothetical protein
MARAPAAARREEIDEVTVSHVKRLAAVAALAAALPLAGACRRGADPLDPANELPFGAIDLPAPNAQVNAVTPIAGWALDDRGIREIRIYVDGRIVNHGGLINARPDVSKVYPQYARGTDLHGWTLLMGFDAPGPHAVIVQAVDSDGATRDIASLTVTAIDR